MVIRTLYRVIKEEDLEKHMASHLQGPMLYHHKFKAAVSGCPNGCSQPQIKDIGYSKPLISKNHCISCPQYAKSCPAGLISVDREPSINYDECIDCGKCINNCPTNSITSDEKGYRIIIGGRLGKRPHLSEHLIVVKSLDDLEYILSRPDESL